MNPVTIGLLAAGGTAGIGVALIVAALSPTRPDLLAVLAGPNHAAKNNEIPDFAGESDVEATRGLRGLQRKLEAALAASRLTSPDSDLNVIGMRRGEYLATRIALTIAALLIGPVYSLIFIMFRLPIPAAIPAGIGVIAAAVTWVAVTSHVAGKAETARDEMRRALVAYLQLMALYRAGGTGTGAALDQAAATSDSWAFRRIAAAIASATRAGKTASAGIGALAIELGIDEIADLSAITDAAATQGATIYTTLMARATSLRSQLRSDEIAAAHVASGRMSIPKAILTMAVMAFLLYPALITLTGT